MNEHRPGPAPDLKTEIYREILRPFSSFFPPPITVPSAQELALFGMFSSIGLFLSFVFEKVTRLLWVFGPGSWTVETRTAWSGFWHTMLALFDLVGLYACLASVIWRHLLLGFQQNAQSGCSFCHCFAVINLLSLRSRQTTVMRTFQTEIARVQRYDLHGKSLFSSFQEYRTTLIFVSDK
ncbi:hypothetical protein BKA70DRAFT_732287 [Coprinopsis sp. MPI-PUGE-AT-0042]|nr:hypothetical protein BKA70DRAFT_732287 [Coprinopsis sp. MPI-PUGE-AT-0042]